MRLIMCEQPDLDNPEVRISYREITEGVKRVADFVRSVDQTVCCKNNSGEYAIPSSDIYYIESVDKKTFVYCATEVFQSNYKLYEIEEYPDYEYIAGYYAWDGVIYKKDETD